MLKCIEVEDIVSMVRDIAKDVEIDRTTDPELRVDIYNISDANVMGMFDDFDPSVLGSLNDKILKKIERSLDIAEKDKSIAESMVYSLLTDREGEVSSTKTARHNAIALSDVLSAITSETNTAINSSVELSKVSGEKEVPFIPLHRLAATIGRKITYLEGLRFVKLKDAKTGPVDVERAYYRTGLVALEALEKAGFITLHAANTGKGSVKNFQEDINGSVDYKNPVSTEYAVAQINLEKFGITSENDSALSYLKNSNASKLKGSKLEVQLKVLTAINTVSQPNTIILPGTGKVAKNKTLDSYKLTPEMQAARKDLQSRPVFVDSELHRFFSAIKSSLAGESASSWINSSTIDASVLSRLFSVERYNDTVANEASHQGRNLSKTVPLDDLVEYYDRLVDGEGNPAAMFMGMFTGSNSRMYSDNSVVDYMASKLMRNSLAVEPYEIETGSAAHNYYMNKIALRLGLKKDGNGDSEALMSTESTPLTVALESYQMYKDAETAGQMLDALTQMSKNFPDMDFADLTTTLKAVSDMRENSNKDSFMTSYMVSSDGTANGAQIMMLMALGTNPEKLTELLKELGIFKNDSGTKTKSNFDVYSLLTNAVKKVIGDGISKPTIAAQTVDFLKNKGTSIPELTKVIQKELFGNVMRDMSKDPTMVIIYQQSSGGAEQSMSRLFAERLLEKIGKGTPSPEIIKLLDTLLDENIATEADVAKLKKEDKNLLIKLTKGFKNTKIPHFLYKKVQEAVVEPYLKEATALRKSIFKIIERSENIKNIRMFPAAAVIEQQLSGLDIKHNTKDLKKFGVPVTKIFEVINKVSEGEAVLTREEKAMITVLGVSGTHSSDAANQFRALSTISSDFDTGVISVHDQANSSAHAIMEYDKRYVQSNFESAYHYDTNEQVILAAIAYDPNLEPKLRGLLETVQSQKAAKQKILDENYDFDTLNVMGDGTPAQAGKRTADSTKRDASKDTPKGQYSPDLETVNPEVEVLRNQIIDALANDTDSILTYDVETSGKLKDNPFIVQMAYKIGEAPPKVVNIKLTQEQAETYLENLKNVESITESSVYKDIEASFNEKNDMASWNSKSKNIGAAKASLAKKAKKAKHVVSFNGLQFDDLLVDGVETTHDLINLVHNRVKFKKAKGRLVDFVKDADGAHGAGADVDMTYKVLKDFAENKVVYKRQQEQQKQQKKSSNKNKSNGTMSNVVKKAIIIKAVGEIGNNSDIVKTYLSNKNMSDLVIGDTSQFDTQTDTITLGNSKNSPAEILEALEHEIIHSFTAGVIGKYFGKKETKTDLGKSLAYMEKALGHLSSKKFKGKTAERMAYINSKGTDQEKMAEFIAIMTTEKEVAAEVYNSLNAASKSKLANVLKFVKDQILKVIRKITAADLKSDNVDPELLFSALSSVVQKGAKNKSLKKSLNDADQKLFKQPLNSPLTSAVIDAIGPIDYVNNAVARYVTEPSLFKATSLTKVLNDKLKAKFPKYLQVTEKLRGVYDSSEGLKSLVHKITNNNVDNNLKNLYLSLATSFRSDHDSLVAEEIRKYRSLKLSDTDKERLYKYTSKMAIQDYFMYAEDVTDIDAEITKMEKDLRKNIQMINSVDSIVEMNVNDNLVSGGVYSVREMSLNFNEIAVARRLLVLKSIKALGESEFKELISNKPLMDLVRDTTLANEKIMEGVNAERSQVRDNQMSEKWDEPTSFRVFSLKDTDKYANTGKKGWVILTPATETTLGVAYMKIIDNTYLDGVFTDTQIDSGDINVPESMANDPRVVRAGDKFKYIISEENKIKAGLDTNPYTNLIGTMASNMTMMDSQIIRDKIMTEDNTYWDMSDKDMSRLAPTIRSKSKDHPWMLGGDKTVTFDSLPKEVQAAYMPVNKKLSNAPGKVNMSDTVQFVRKDINYWLVGASDKSMVESPIAKWALRITKRMVTSSKINMVILNPAKIAADMASNLTHLGIAGANPLTLRNSFSKTSTAFEDYRKLKNELNALKVKGYTTDSVSLKNKIKDLSKKIDNHEANGYVKRGFVSSLGSELIVNNGDTSGAFTKDVDSVLKFIFKDNEGKNNDVGNFIMKAAKWNVGIEDLLETFSPLFGVLGSTEVMQNEMNKIASHFKNIKSEEDLITYLHQYIASPNSSFVKLGSHMTDLNDLMARQAYYELMISDRGMSEREAEVAAIDFFPDYKEGLPMAVKKLSDVGIVPFPNHMLRITKALLMLAKDRPVSFGTDVAIQNYFEINTGMWDSGIWKVLDPHSGGVQNPFNYFDIANLFPTRAL